VVGKMCMCLLLVFRAPCVQVWLGVLLRMSFCQLLSELQALPPLSPTGYTNDGAKTAAVGRFAAS
jgi:hypothetical protein